jgi:purine-binding chemotaxis protein CheW
MAAEADQQRNALRKRLGELEAELVKAQAALAALGVGEPLPGLYLVLDIAGTSAVVPAAMVSEIVRLVDFTPVPRAPSHVLGTFLYRGEPAVAVDLAGVVGQQRQPSLDAHVVVLSTSRRIGLVVDRVRTLVEAPVVADSSEDDGTLTGWLGSPLVAGLCRSERGLMPLLDVQPLLEGVDL